VLSSVVFVLAHPRENPIFGPTGTPLRPTRFRFADPTSSSESRTAKSDELTLIESHSYAKPRGEGVLCSLNIR
jgi:hypothetical protein